MPSLKEIRLMVFANLQYCVKARETHFENNSDQLSILFSFTESEDAQYENRKRKLSSIFGRAATIAIMF
jgi:hypothetical protein